MKAFLLVFLLLNEGALAAACLSGSLSKPLDLNFDLKGAEDAVQEFETNVKRELPRNTSLVINLEALNPRVNAEVNKKEGDIIIQIMGGMLMHPKMGNDVLKLLLCHEIGHVLGGSPLKSRNGWSSTEGQADFYSTATCVKNLRFTETDFIDAAMALTAIYAEVTREIPPRLDACDERKVDRTNYGYPAVQCRLDTLMAGWQGQERPRCWFRD